MENAEGGYLFRGRVRGRADRQSVAPRLALASPGPGNAFGDHDLPDILAVNGDGGKRAPMPVLLPTVLRVADMDLDRARGQQLADAVLGNVSQSALGIALRVPGFRRIDVGDADMRLVDDDGVAVDDVWLRESDARCGQNC